MLKAVQFAWRSLWRSRDYALASVTLATIGIASLTTVFAVADAVLVRPIRYPEPDALYFLSAQHQPDGANFPPSVTDFQDFERRSTSFDGMGIVLVGSVVVASPDGAATHRVAYASPSLLDALRIRPSIGRALDGDDDRPGAPSVMVLSHEAWTRVFGGDSAVVGRLLTTASGGITVIGVLPPGAMFPGYATGLSPIGPYLAQHADAARRDARTGTLAIARLRHNASLSTARAELTTIADQLAAAYPATNANWGASLTSLREVVTERFQSSMLLLLAAAALVLVIAASNVAVLSLVRAGTRGRESAVRRALGAGAAATISPRVLEATMLVTLGGVAGLLLSKWVLSLVSGGLTSVAPRAVYASVDSRAVLVAAGATVLLLPFAIFPALPHTSAKNLIERLKSGVVAGRHGRHRHWTQSLLIATQITLTLVIALAGLSVTGANLRALREGPGFHAERIISIPVEPPESRYASISARQALYSDLKEAVLALPGVERVGVINHAPLTQSGVLTAVEIAGVPLAAPGSNMAVYRTVDEHYFTTVGQIVVQGRGFDQSDMSEGSRGVVVNQSFAKKFWPGAAALGKALRVFDQSQANGRLNTPLDVHVVGIVQDVKDWGFSRPPLPAVYVPSAVSPWPNAFLAIRTRVPPPTLLPSVKGAIAKVDPMIPVSAARTGDDLVRESEAPRRVAMWIVIALGVTAALLACFGVYAVISQQVALRARETGIRAAIGAAPRHIVGGFVRRGLLLGAAGVAVGLCLTPLLARLLAWATPTPIRVEWGTATIAAVGLLAIATLAALIPARRAAHAQATQLLRGE